MRILSSTILLALCSSGLLAQAPSNPKFDAHKTFDPIFYPSGSTLYRSAGGAPGERYWTNRADYTIHTTLDTTAQSISGGVTVTYTNNSPDALPFLWLQLDQNIYQQNSPGQATNPVTGGAWR